MFELFSNLIPILKDLPPNLNKGFIEPHCSVRSPRSIQNNMDKSDYFPEYKHIIGGNIDTNNFKVIKYAKQITILPTINRQMGLQVKWTHSKEAMFTLFSHQGYENIISCISAGKIKVCYSKLQTFTIVIQLMITDIYTLSLKYTN